MANVWINSAGSDTSPYDTRAKGATSPLTATAFASAGDDIWMVVGTTYNITVDTTYDLSAGTDANPIKWHACTDTGTTTPDALATTGHIKGTTSTTDIIFKGNFKCYGIHFEVNGNFDDIKFCADDQDVEVFEQCEFTLKSAGSGGTFVTGTSSVGINTYLNTKNCTFNFDNHASQRFYIYGRYASEGDTFALLGGSAPSVVFPAASHGPASFHGSDFSALATTIVTGASVTPMMFTFNNCTMHASATWVDTISSKAQAEVYISDSSVGDVHYEFAHYDYFGNTTVSATIYANDTGAAKYDGTNGYSLKVTGTNATISHPYVSPWVKIYHDGTSAITPTFEVVRDGSATAYQDDEVWGEWAVKDNTGLSSVTYYDDRAYVLDTPANQATGDLGASDWTGEGGTAWFGKLVCPSVTPAEIGHISGRVCVSGAYTVYVDPTIRGV